MIIYTLKTCDSCRKATKWLRQNHFEFEEIAIRDQPPSKTELKAALESVNGEIRKLFNTSGQDYRALSLKDKLPTMSDEDALSLLASNGNLVKRPFFKNGKTILIGFKEEIWRENLLK
ncbi:MAG: arsenate reductase family protein [Akkermansiaceae bacterium]